MNVDRKTIQTRCSEAVFERGENYRDEDRIQDLDRFDDLVTATVRGSTLYRRSRRLPRGLTPGLKPATPNLYYDRV